MKYEINEGTLAIIPMDNSRSKVLEDNIQYVIEEKAFAIMDSSCKYFGSSYRGRKEGSKEILGIGYKVPVIVEDGRNIVFFPTISPDDNECIWLASKKIKNIEAIDEISTKVIFNNNTELELPISFRSLENQLFRATRLESIIRNRKNT